MKRIFMGIVIISSILGSTMVYAEANDQAVSEANENAVFVRMSDWFATAGKSKDEQMAILEKRKAEREKHRIAKKAEIRKKKLEKQVTAKTLEAKDKAKLAKKERQPILTH